MHPPSGTRPANTSVAVEEATVGVEELLVVSVGDVAVLESSHPDTVSAAARSRPDRPRVTLSGRRVSVLDVTS